MKKFVISFLLSICVVLNVSLANANDDFSIISISDELFFQSFMVVLIKQTSTFLNLI